MQITKFRKMFNNCFQSKDPFPDTALLWFVWVVGWMDRHALYGFDHLGRGVDQTKLSFRYQEQFSNLNIVTQFQVICEEIAVWDSTMTRS